MVPLTYTAVYLEYPSFFFGWDLHDIHFHVSLVLDPVHAEIVGDLVNVKRANAQPTSVRRVEADVFQRNTLNGLGTPFFSTVRHGCGPLGLRDDKTKIP